MHGLLVDAAKAVAQRRRNGRNLWPMGTSSQILVDLDVDLDEAPAVGAHVLDWLLSNGVVASTPYHYTELLASFESQGMPVSPSLRELLQNERGWPPGPTYERWVDDVNPVGTREGRYNLFVIDVGRNVHAFPADDETCRCPVGHEGLRKTIIDAVEEWYAGKDPVVRCDTCGREWAITRWDLGEGMAIGNLGLRFDDWGFLTPALVDELRRLVAPHATKLIAGKL
jgi:hypothetical protein